MMSVKKRFLIIFSVITFAALLPSIYYLVQQFREDAVVTDYLEQHEFDNLPISKSTAIAVARQVDAEFNVDPTTFKTLKMDDRPFLREDAKFLLTNKEGLCGEGARVIIRLLNQIGFDATRVTLYDRYMQFAHTVVSIRLNDQNFWIDTINSKDSLTSLFERENISEDNFKYLTYSSTINERLKRIDEHQAIDETYQFKKNMGEYFLYSFEAIPVTKLLSAVNIEKRVFNLRRPPHFVSVLAEKPNMIMFWFCFFIAIGIVLLVIKPLRRFLSRPA